MSRPSRIVCVVEGHGDVGAVPVLVTRILREVLAVKGTRWAVDASAIRHARSFLVDEATPSPNRPCHEAGMRRAMAQAVARAPDAVLFLVDADDDCPAVWGGSMPAVAWAAARQPVAGVMASREFEIWILASYGRARRSAVGAREPERAPRDAKKALGKIVAGYAPSTHQTSAARGMDLKRAWAVSASFDKLVRSVAYLTARPAPHRPIER